MNIALQFSAAEYNCNAYGAGTYNSASCTSGTVDNPGALAATGFDILLPISLGFALVIAGGLLIARRALRRKRSQPTT